MSLPVVTIVLPLRRVFKSEKSHDYVVQVWDDDLDRYKSVSKPYHHSTSAFAALGRLTQKDTRATLEAEGATDKL